MSQKTIHFILALHNHQPEGNFDDVFRKTFQVAYEPFIGVLEDFPEIKVVQHYSGILLRWLQENKPAFLARLRELTSSGRLELMSGAFYEPILVMIPDEDKTGQIEKMNRFLRENFHVQAEGAWLAERVWEPHLARPLAEAGIRYTVLDDYHFRCAGFTTEQLLHYYLTEEEGRKLFVFPINEKLRYLIPFADPEETVDYLAKMADEEDRVVVLADDGEKFGSWPGTAKLVYQEKWLRRFFKLLAENSGWLKTVTFSELLAAYPPAGRVYLPSCSYREMMEWSGGFWRNYFVRYPESNQLHKKMLYVRKKVQQMDDGPQKKEAREYLWAGQCNCAYWHGIFGGLYLNFLRSALYSRLVAAEDLADRALHREDGWLEMKHFDFDYDGKKEIIINGPEINFVLAPEQGGALLELDFKPRRFNLLDVLTRRQEAYHCDLFEQAEGLCGDEKAQSIHHIKRVKEAGLEQFLCYDDYRRASLLDHFFPRSSNLRNFNCEKHDTGGFATARYRLQRAKAEDDSAVVVMAREGVVRLEGKRRRLMLKKSVSHQPRKNELAYDYQLLSREKEAFDLLFAVEFNINFLAPSASDRYYTAGGTTLRDRSLSSRGCLKDLGQFGMVDEWQGLSCNFRFDRPTTVWRMPLETVSRSEEKIERNYQGSTLLFTWDIRLLPNTPWAVTFTQSITELVREGQK